MHEYVIYILLSKDFGFFTEKKDKDKNEKGRVI